MDLRIENVLRQEFGVASAYLLETLTRFHLHRLDQKSRKFHKRIVSRHLRQQHHRLVKVSVGVESLPA
jgi:hypothetical protein